MRKLTDFHLATLSGKVSSLMSIYWCFESYRASEETYLLLVILGLVITIAMLTWSLVRHEKTGRKPIQGNDDIDYRIDLYMRRKILRELDARAFARRHRESQNKFKRRKGK